MRVLVQLSRACSLKGMSPKPTRPVLVINLSHQAQPPFRIPKAEYTHKHGHVYAYIHSRTHACNDTVGVRFLKRKAKVPRTICLKRFFLKFRKLAHSPTMKW